MIAQIACFAFLLAASNAGVLVGEAGHAVIDVHTPPKYEFKYGVTDPKTGDRKEQQEVRVGDVVKGEYSLAEPDGTIRVVKYTADAHNGFNAVVSRVGHAVHPQVIHKAVVPAVAHLPIAPAITHVPVAQTIAHVAHVPVATHGVALGGIGLLGGQGGILGDGLLGGRGDGGLWGGERRGLGLELGGY